MFVVHSLAFVRKYELFRPAEDLESYPHSGLGRLAGSDDPHLEFQVKRRHWRGTEPCPGSIVAENLQIAPFTAISMGLDRSPHRALYPI